MKTSSSKSNELLKPNLESNHSVEINFTNLVAKQQSKSNEKTTQTDLGFEDLNNLTNSNTRHLNGSSLHSSHREPNKIKFSKLNLPKPFQVELTKSYYNKTKLKISPLQTKSKIQSSVFLDSIKIASDSNYSFNPVINSTNLKSLQVLNKSNNYSTKITDKALQAIEDNEQEFKVNSVKLFNRNITTKMTDETHIIKKDENILFKSLIIDLKQNEIRTSNCLEISENNIINSINDETIIKKVTETTSNNNVSNDYNPEELIKSEFSRSFIEKFFDGKLSSAENSNEQTISENSVQINELKHDHKEQKKYENENIDESSVNKSNVINYVENFVEKFFNSDLKMNKIENKSAKKEENEILKTSKLNIINPTLDEKLNFLKSFENDDEILNSVINSYIKAYNLLNNSKSNSSNLLDDNVLLILKLQKNCSCVLNDMKCCIETIFKQINNDNIKLPDSFKEYLCCANCKPIFQHQTNEDLLNGSNLSEKEKNKFRKKFFCSSSVDTDDEKDDGTVENKNTTHKHDDSDKTLDQKSSNFNTNINNYTSKNTISTNISTETPRKAIMKKSNSKFNIKDNKTNSVRKSVHFIEDEKYGFLPIEIPEWQENLREPVYSGKYRKNLPEWKP